MEEVVLVDENDIFLGLMEKNLAHETASLHRAISIFIFNENNEMLLQQRAKTKYHSPELWTNACCSHPKNKETYLDAAKRRLFEELRIECILTEKFHFIYKAEVGENFWEHELDYVFLGTYSDVNINFNTNEVMALKWIKIDDLMKDIKLFPEKYTVWFRIILEQYILKLSSIEN